MRKRIIKRIVFIFFVAILFSSLIKLNTYAVEQSVIDNAFEILDTGLSYTIEAPGDYKILANDDWNTQIVLRDESTIDNPVRIFILGDITYYNVGSDGTHPMFSFIQSNDKYVEIIGVGDEPPIINETCLTNIVMFQTTSRKIHLKMENLIINASGGNNIVNVQSNPGEKAFEFNNMTFQNWQSTSAGFAVNLTSSTGKLTAQLTNCKFLNNGGTTGGGFMIAGNASNKATATLTNCYFEGNSNIATNKTTGNTAGSINVRAYSSLTMIDCSIIDGGITGTTNTGILAPGGIAVAKNGTCILENVEITGNQAYGVYNAGTLTLKGNTNINNNEKGNLYLTSENKFIIEEDFTGITGVTVPDNPDYNIERQITTNQSTNYQEVLKNINVISDNRNYTVRHGDTNYLYLWKHDHIWEYESQENIVEAVCTADLECYYYKNSIKLILNAEDMVYTGNTYDKSSVENNITTITGATAGEIYYEGRGDTVYEKTTVPPIEVGTYTASIEIAGEQAIKDFSILFQTCNVTVIKKWEDNNNSYNARPTSIVVELLQNNVVIQEVELNNSNEWKYVFENLRTLDDSKQLYIYTIREKNSIDGYFLKEITELDKVFTITNAKAGTIKINKEDLLTGEKLKGAVFKLERKISDDEWEIVERYTTDSEGNIVIKNLTYGTYKLTEIKAPDGYNLNLENAEIELEINESNVNYELTVSNKAKPTLPATGAGKFPIILLMITIVLIILPSKVYKKIHINKMF